MATHSAAVEIRRENLRRLIRERFDNRRSTFAKTVDIQPNQVNLMLTDNLSYQRPVSEETARKIERNMGLPVGWFDRAPEDNAPPGLTMVRALQVMPELLPVLTTSTMLGSMTVTEGWLAKHYVQRPAQLWLAQVASDGMEPQISMGDHIILEWLDAELPGSETFSRDGCYIIISRTGPVIRRVQRTTTEWVISSPNGSYSRETHRDLKKVKLQARVLTKLDFG